MRDSAYLDDIEGDLVLDSQDIAAVLESIGSTETDITGAVVVVGDGDYLGVWLTDSNRPYHVNALYWRAV